MAHKEYGVTDILDLLRRAKAKDSQRRMARATSMDRKTVRNYLALACKHGFDETTAHEQLPEIAAAVFREVHGGQNKSSAPGACAPLLPHRELLCGWLEKDGLTLTKAHIKLGRMGGRRHLQHPLPLCSGGSRLRRTEGDGADGRDRARRGGSSRFWPHGAGLRPRNR